MTSVDNSGQLCTGAGTSENLTDEQRRAVRAVARVTPGQEEPIGTFINLDTVGDHRVDAVQDAPEDADIVSVGMRVNTVTQMAVFDHMLFSTIPLRANNQYLVFADLDGNPATGGAPSTLGFPTSFQGAELVTCVVVTFGGDPYLPRAMRGMNEAHC